MQKTLSIFFTILLLATSAYARPSLPMQERVLNILIELEKGNLEVEKNFSHTSLVYLRNWPQQPLEGLKSYLSDNDYYDYDSSFPIDIAYSDPSGEYQLKGDIKRSLVIKRKKETLYMAVYSMYGGEWGREECFLKYIVLNTEGETLYSGRIEDDYCDAN